MSGRRHRALAPALLALILLGLSSSSLPLHAAPGDKPGETKDKPGQDKPEKDKPEKDKPAKATADTSDKTEAAKPEDAVRRELPEDRKPKTPADGRPVLIKGATLLTVADPTPIEGGSILLEDGRIKAIAKAGESIEAPKGAVVIDGEGLYISPGIIDCHSHMAVEGGLNEMAEKMSPEVRIGDVIDPEDVSLYRALAGGVTAALTLHGSANPIGGQAAVIKLRWGSSPEAMLFEGAPRGIKFALGENPKRRAGFPKTRQGIAATLRRSFEAGKRYAAALEAYEAAKARGEPAIPPRRDLRLETYAGILSGEIRIHCHCYRADEILMLLRVCDEYGIKVATLQHVLEGYKIAPEIARHGAGASTFSDWWAYKIEAFDAIPQNAALLTAAGVLTSINSDSPELVRHLNLEAAKTVRYGGLSLNAALRLVTLNPATQLGINERVGTLEVGKDADLAVWNDHPLSSFSRCVMTFVDGKLLFEAPAPRPKGLEQRRFKAARVREPVALAEGTSATLLLRRVTIHMPDGAPQLGSLLIREGKIVKRVLGRQELAMPKDARLLEGSGIHVSPGLIDAGTQLGLTEIGAVEETVDLREAGRWQPDLAAADGYNPQSELIPVARLGGTTTAVSLPRGGLIPGRASIVHLAGNTLDEVLIKRDFGLVVNFPASRPGKEKSNKALQELEALIVAARRYHERRTGDPASKVDARLEALRPVLTRELPVLIALNGAKEIIEAVEWCRKQKLRLILRGARESWKIADYLAWRKIPVLFGPVMSVPRGDQEPWDSIYSAPARLRDAGVRFALQTNDASNARILPFEAAMAAAHGLTPEQALRAVTLSAAKILGIDQQRGSIEEGKQADLIVTLGHPLEATSRVIAMLVDGRVVSLESKQTRLARRFAARNAAVMQAGKSQPKKSKGAR